jgi:hypothetical protein
MTLASIRSCNTFSLLNVAFLLIARVVIIVQICAWKALDISSLKVKRSIFLSTKEYMRFSLSS